ncbi:hypothetical protein ACFVOK_38720 [Streptomyces sp. NPDC057798]|uniref:hypothetical protein n=1 Tax=Streptomyces sp. NPDC057798 TaxID=3346252 RepID=UPI00368945CC
MPQSQPQPDVPAVRTENVLLLFAHEPYHPGPGTREVNTTVVSAASLLHAQVRQPDGVSIHDLLTRGRRAGEIVPLSTLTHELDGGALWPQVGDWEAVTSDLVHLVRGSHCDAFSLGLPLMARALLCAGPTSEVVRAHAGTPSHRTTYGPEDRGVVLAEIDRYLTPLLAELPLWPGESLLPPLNTR